VTDKLVDSLEDDTCEGCGRPWWDCGGTCPGFRSCSTSSTKTDDDEGQDDVVDDEDRCEDCGELWLDCKCEDYLGEPRPAPPPAFVDGHLTRPCGNQACNKRVPYSGNRQGGDLGRPQKYCSDYCRQAAYRDRRAAKWRLEHTFPAGSKWTSQCGAVFENAKEFVGTPDRCPFCRDQLLAAYGRQAELFVSTSSKPRKTSTSGRR
jgi:hypothetical protein